MNLNDLVKMDSAQRIEAIKSLSIEDMAVLKAAVRQAEKPVDEELLKLEAEKAELQKNPEIAQYLEVLAAIKAKRARVITADKKYRHDEKYATIELEDGTMLKAEGKGWKQIMQKAGYTIGQVAMVLKGQRGFKDGAKYPNTLSVRG